MSLLRCTSIFLIALLWQAAGSADKRYIVLPAAEWKDAAHYLPASGDQKPTDGWLPDQAI